MIVFGIVWVFKKILFDNEYLFVDLYINVFKYLFIEFMKYKLFGFVYLEEFKKKYGKKKEMMNFIIDIM